MAQAKKQSHYQKQDTRSLDIVAIADVVAWAPDRVGMRHCQW